MKNIFWDSCVIAAFLNDETNDFDIPSLKRFIYDAKSGGCKLYASGLTTAEILPSYLQDKKFSSYQRFLADMEGAFVLINPNQDIMSLSAQLRDIPYSKLVNKNDVAKRRMDVPDAVMLATGIILQDGFGVSLDAFHTYDNGKKRSAEGGKCVPLLTFETWCERLNAKHKAIAQRAIALPRCRPIHPSPDLPGV